MLTKIEVRRRRGQQRIRWLDGITGHEFEQTLGDGKGQESLACCSPCGHKESDTTEHAHIRTDTRGIRKENVKDAVLTRSRKFIPIACESKDLHCYRQ